MKKIMTCVLFLCVMSFMYAEKISIYVEPGEVWSKRAPQLALWIEDGEGNYIETIYVTKSAAKKSWKFAPKEGRPESLPCWYKASGVNPAKEGIEVDVCSGATPKKGLFIEHEIDLDKNTEYLIKGEVNQSFDYNEFYTKKNSGVDGQPSVEYFGKLDFKKETALVICEHSDKINTADKIISHIYVDVK